MGRLSQKTWGERPEGSVGYVVFVLYAETLLGYDVYRILPYPYHISIYVAHFLFWRYDRIRTQRAAVASRRATNMLATYLPVGKSY
jgi:hypothetical protein